MTARIQAPRRRRTSASSQPRLPFPIPSTGFRGGLAAEVSTPCAEPFDSDDWLFSVEWEGSRCLLISDSDGSIRLQGEMASLDDRFPEIVAAGPLAGSREAVLDGSVCVLDAEGRPDLAVLFARVHEGTRGRPPAVFLATDLLRVDGAAITDRPLPERLARLAELVPRDSRIQMPDHVAAHGRALAGAATARGLRALLARRLAAPYRPGVASPDRLRIPLTGRRDAVVVGWYSTSSGVRVVLADWVQRRLELAGTAAVSGPATTRWLAGAVEVAADLAPIQGAVTAGPGVTWVRPRLVATVDPSTDPDEAGPLPEYRMVALRDDVDPQWCLRRQPVPAPQAAALLPLRAFSPTVLSALPIDDGP